MMTATLVACLHIGTLWLLRHTVYATTTLDLRYHIQYVTEYCTVIDVLNPIAIVSCITLLYFTGNKCVSDLTEANQRPALNCRHWCLSQP